MTQKELLEAIRKRNHQLAIAGCWVDAIVLRRYRNGRPESVRVDDSTTPEAQVPSDVTHVIVVVEAPIEAINRFAMDVV